MRLSLNGCFDEMADAGEDATHFQARFISKSEAHAVPKTPFSLPSTVGCAELNSLINGILHHGEKENINFDFLINGHLIRSKLGDFVAKNKIQTESVIEIEYILKSEAPQLQHSLLHDDWVSCIDVAHQRILSGSYDFSARIWTMKGDMQKEIQGHTAAIKGVSWGSTDDDQHTILTSSQDQTVRVWQWSTVDQTCDCIHVCKGHAGSVDCISCSPDKQKFCSGSWDSMIKIWSAVPDLDATDEIDPERDIDRKRIKSDRRKATTRTPIQTMSGHTEGVSSIQWTDSTEIISAGWDHCIRLWDVLTGVSKENLSGKKVITSISYSKLSGLIASGSTDKYVRLWDPKSADGFIVKSTLSSHDGWISSVSWSPASQYELISGAYDSVVKVWDVRSTNSSLYSLNSHQDKVMCVNWKVPETLLSGGSDNKLAIHSYTRGGIMTTEE